MSIVNEKGSDLVQLEFQSLGSSSMSTMLIQPLLEHASQYNCHLVNLHTALGDSAIPGGQRLFKVVVSPWMRRQQSNSADLQSLGAQLTAQQNPVVMSHIFTGALPSAAYTQGVHTNLVTVLKRLEGEGSYEQVLDTNMHDWNVHANSLPDDFGVPFEVRTPEHCVSSLDLIWSIQEQLRKISGQVNKYASFTQQQFNDRNWTTEAVPHNMISLTVNLRGQVGLRVLPLLFKAGFMIVFDDLWRKLTGDNKRFAMCAYETSVDAMTGVVKYKGEPKYLTDGTELVRMSADHLAAGGTMAQHPWGFINMLNVMQTVEPNANPVLLPPLDLQFGDNIFELADLRKQMVLDVTLPVDSTLRWNSDEPEIRHQLQEFELNPGQFSGHVNIGGNSIIEQRQYVGDRVLLNNAHSLSVKKLFEGQMQAVRLEVLLRSLQWNKDTKELENKLLPVEFDEGEFFYTKLVFCKEVV